MFSGVTSFLYRHKKKIIFGGVFVGGFAFAFRYAQHKILQWQENEAKEFLNSTRKQQHFEATERTCNQTVLSLAPSLYEAVDRLLDSENIVSRLRNSGDKQASIVNLWEELKVLAFARIVLVLYANVLLVVSLRVQVNLIGSYLYKDSMKEQQEKQISGLLQEKYLSMCQFFLNDGMKNLSNLIYQKVRSVVSRIPLQKQMYIGDVEQLFWSVHGAITEVENPLKCIQNYVLNSDVTNEVGCLDAREAELFKKIVIETGDILESEEIASLANSLVCKGFCHIVDKIADIALLDSNQKVKAIPSDLSNVQSGSVQVNGIHNEVFIHPNTVSIPMAKLIPIVNGLSKATAGFRSPDSLIQFMILNERLKVLGANVYELFCE